MPLSSGEAEIDAVLFDLDDVLVPFHTQLAWQWAWRPQGPPLGERRVQAALRRSLHAWDRRRWQGLTGRLPPADLAALQEHLTATLKAIAARGLPPEESAAVVRRILRPAGEIERFPDAALALGRLAARGVRCGIVTPLPAESAHWLLRRTGLPDSLLLGAGDPGSPVVPDRQAFRAAAERLGSPPARTAYVGDLFWSDVRAAHRAGLSAFLLDRPDSFPHVAVGRMRSLGELEATIERGPAPPPVEGTGVPSGSPPSGGNGQRI
ncbi:MAG: HAD family hydrolase [Thermoplasmata archaeon]